MLRPEDLEEIQKKGISEETFKEQLDRFKNGFPYLKIKSVATVGNGIMKLSEQDEADCEKTWEEFLKNGGTVEKFVPASGAASRMFKNLFEFVSGGNEIPETDFMRKFFAEIENFAFFSSLDHACRKAYNKGVKELIADGKNIEVVKCLITDNGLNYGGLPKGMLQFHKVGNEIHTPIEEHLEEGAQYATDKNGNVNIHFTVSPEHRSHFEALLDEKIPEMEKKWGVKYNVTLSEQKSSTDTVAVTMDNVPYRENGKLLFRPAGHGALIENLNDIDTDVVFIKNIDNVVPINLRESTVKYKKVIGGYLMKVQQRIAQYVKALKSGNYTMDNIREMITFLHDTLNTRFEGTKKLEDSELALYVLGKLNRPIRVCGVVKNDGEPGGGPYLAYNADGTTSPQILESAQFDKNDPKSVELIKSGSHFNPVDLVCYLKDFEGNKFDLKKYVDKNTGLISEKSKSWVEIKALELPGLWNGSMSDWNTIFVEVPISTFNPVKTVNDLLRPQHQG